MANNDHEKDKLNNSGYDNASITHSTQGVPAEKFVLHGRDKVVEEKFERKSRTFWQDAWAQLKSNKLAVIGLIGLVLLTLLSLVGPLMNDHKFSDQNVSHANLPPKIPVLDQVPFLPFDGTDRDGFDVYEGSNVNENYWFGTDELGRDLWTRTWRGTQVSLFIGVIAAALDIFIGVIYGALSGYFGGRTDDLMQRIVEILSSIPNLIVVILFVLLFDPSIWTIILAMSVTGWLGMSRIVRGQFLKLKEQEFVMASRTLGVSNYKLIFKHILPNTLGPIIVTSMFTVPSAIFFEAFLSFIGLGIPAPQASLGSLVDTGRKMLLIFPHELFVPAVVLSLLILFFYLFSDGLRDAFDPKMRK
ncbi:oligopeptide ABC transporter permease [Mammaliicoccus lentus]|uniref:oligopeptide ABC transporter permease n=1 Tax=Mammaliicoccus lentus TaxID=42858 RepID=UPI001BDA32EE|nr:oligopeptide ABC transporter permease [Mammaliicoccus lentus]